ncbi:hypothetical protein ACRE_055320 [Hapsidospora chrysogenum ATCC 11550]|uniref:Uncharacterized protein n=1 Tax=Hapsidospora chrysogenum (strain ATCC 11550 / CBS 779.69 / DSM 880 / IAM 14645 / JCM 23072 / IMI 49137) TaxID=857340 RepID=A0A086T2Z6_HAPC1|nr:hypothetical protein ACRE_055320 [Hapsidospora chrysogenum ATCC 11550]
MSIFSNIRKNRHQLKEHRAKHAEQRQKGGTGDAARHPPRIGSSLSDATPYPGQASPHGYLPRAYSCTGTTSPHPGSTVDVAYPSSGFPQSGPAFRGDLSSDRSSDSSGSQEGLEMTDVTAPVAVRPSTAGGTPHRLHPSSRWRRSPDSSLDRRSATTGSPSPQNSSHALPGPTPAATKQTSPDLHLNAAADNRGTNGRPGLSVLCTEASADVPGKNTQRPVPRVASRFTEAVSPAPSHTESAWTPPPNPHGEVINVFPEPVDPIPVPEDPRKGKRSRRPSAGGGKLLKRNRPSTVQASA